MALNEKELQVIRAFLIERRSHRWIEENIFGIAGASRRDVSIVDILDNYGLNSDYKNLLADITSRAQFDQLLKDERELLAQQKLTRQELLELWEPTQHVYLYQRVIRNKEGWMKPCVGRRGYKKDGDYLRDNGFGHEDWNFNTSLTFDGHMYGYVYYGQHGPAKNKRHKKFNIAFVERHLDGSWWLAGLYRNTSYIEDGAPMSKPILQRKMLDLQMLREMGSLGEKWDISPPKMKKKLEDELSYLKWKVRPADVVSTPFPIKIPSEIPRPPSSRIANPCEISEETFKKLINLTDEIIQMSFGEDDRGHREGTPKLIKHWVRERKRAVVAEAKERFFAKHGRLFCEACGFDFSKTYGKRGEYFIEAHHTIPVSKLKDGDETLAKDLAMLCANCHRMVHREPFLPMEALKESMKTK